MSAVAYVRSRHFLDQRWVSSEGYAVAIRIGEPLSVDETDLPGVWRLQWSPIADDRGSVQPIFVASQLRDSVLPPFTVAQTNLTRSTRGVIRGVHGEFMQKVVAVLAGRIYAAGVDLRTDSPTFGRHVEFDLGPDEGLFLSPGIGNAFQSTSDEPSLYLYMFDQEWWPGMPGIHVNALDPDLAIQWPILDPQNLSEKDRRLPALASLRS